MCGIPADSCNGDNQWLTQPDTLTPVGSLSDPRATATNPDYLERVCCSRSRAASGSASASSGKHQGLT